MFVNVTKLLPGSSTADCTRDTIVFAGKCIPATPPMTTSTTSGVCPDGSTPDANGNCLTCPSNTQLFDGKCVGQLPVIPGSNTGTGGGFIQLGNAKPTVVYVPMNKDGTCPPGDVPASGGYCRHSIQSTPPAAPPTNTPPAQPQPSQPVCEPGFHWDTTQQECVPNGPK
ncbi:MAG TPA: hypothetical protein VJ729_14925 [Nitrososphaeraceae archaeon]|nr:hypothetical protein [Nitrososphaeraceae archaeon]